MSNLSQLDELHRYFTFFLDIIVTSSFFTNQYY